MARKELQTVDSLIKLISDGELNDAEQPRHLRFNGPDRDGLLWCLKGVVGLIDDLWVVAGSWERDSKALPPELAKLYEAHANTLRAVLNGPREP